jgi:hypothetical protein
VIILSGVLVVVAIALLGAGIVPGIVSGDADSAQVLGVDALVIIYLSIAVSVVSAICLAIGVFLRRKELFGANASAAGRGRKPAQARKGTGRTAPAAAGRGKGAAGKAGAATTAPLSSQASKVPGDAVVFVVRGRKRYHLATCRQLAGREKEELTYAEAREEGFSSCTACMPDTALAARAAVSVPAGGPAPSAKAGGSAPAAKAAPAAEPAPLAKQAPAGKPPAAGPGGTAPLPEASTTTEMPAAPAASGASAAATPRPAGEDTPPPGFRSDPLEVSGRGATDPVTGSGRPAPARPSEAPDAPRPEGDDVSVRILRGTKRYHLPECALLEDVGDGADDLETLPRSEAKARDCTPCLVCRPE